MANEYFGPSNNGMYGGYGQPYNAPGGPYLNSWQNYMGPRNNGPYQPPMGPQPNPAAINGQNPQQMQNASNVNWIYVPNLEAAKNVSIMPSQTLYIMNQNKNEFYLKTSNEMGVSTLRVCPFSVYDASDYEKKEQIEQAQTISGEFVGRDEFNTFAQNVSQQFAMIQQGATAQQQPQVQPVAVTMPVQAPVIQTPSPAPVEAPATAPSKPTASSKKAKE